MPEPPFASLGFQLFLPHPLLRPYVRSYWCFRSEIPLPAPRDEYMNPSGGFGMIFNFGAPLRLDAQEISQPVFLDGANTVARKASFIGHVDLIGVRFYEGGAYPFLGIPLDQLQNEISFLAALERNDLLQLHARLYEVKTLPARIDLLEAWLLDRLALGKTPDALIPASLALLRDRRGDMPIPELAHALAIGQRQLERLYQSQVGMSPKQYSRLLRVETARLALKHVNTQTTTRLAAELGYYDQAHFIREFNTVIGITPYAYLKRVRK